MARILVAYATKRGSTREVAEAIAERLRGHGLDVELEPAGEVRELDGFDGVVLGGSVYVARWHADAKQFLRRHREPLRELPLAVFAMGPLTTDEVDARATRKQLDSALAKTPDLEPFTVAIFGGVVDPAKLPFPLNRMPASDSRDWDAVAAWADEVAERFLADTSPPA